MPGSRARRGVLCFFLMQAMVAGAVVTASSPATAQVGPFHDIAPTHYVEISDGTLIAVNVRMPEGYVEGKRYPTIFEMSGYDGASVDQVDSNTVAGDLAQVFGQDSPELDEGSRQLTEVFYDRYVTIHASVRGTGCSGGEFDLFSWRSALDGKEVIDWIARQAWSNGKVALYGHSYGGITGFMVAATQPPQLVAMSVSGLIDDLYRGITYPGGIANVGFPVVWTVGVRNFYDVVGGTGQALVTSRDAQCLENLTTHRRNVANDPVVQGLMGRTDNDWYRARSLITYAPLIEVPIQITGTYQDEQTGPRGPTHLWEAVRGVPKRLVISNGDHDVNYQSPAMEQDRRKWLDHWMLGEDHGFGSVREDRTSVTTFLEMRTVSRLDYTTSDDEFVPNGRIDSRRFPLEQTRWTRFYLRAGGRLTTGRPGDGEAAATYLSGPGRQAWSYQAGYDVGPPVTTARAPDELDYRSERLKKPTAIVGPIVADLSVSATAVDTDLFVQMVDEAPDGSLTYVQRGILRASHRAIDPALSDWGRTRRESFIYRPWRPHTNPQQIMPGAAYRYLVEVWPVGHVFRPGHRILVKIHAPPVMDSFYAYASESLPSLNTVHHARANASYVLLPVVPLRGVDLGPSVPCGELTAVRCVP
ncbi:MAG: CocE/NonD family hydrolase [Actinomycetota bacterium]|nr:CocE/NonD family hydrolase [Actinomycetota bacterium]